MIRNTIKNSSMYFNMYFNDSYTIENPFNTIRCWPYTFIKCKAECFGSNLVTVFAIAKTNLKSVFLCIID